jgi:methionyl-tRNA formyltransferase
MLLAESVDIRPDDTTGTLHDRLAPLGGRLVVQALGLAATGGLTRTPQPAEGVTYAHKIDKAEAAIDWRQPAAPIERRIRAFDPFPGASATLDGQTVKVWRASVVEGRDDPGRVLVAEGDTLVVATGDQALQLHELQRAGGKRMPAHAFLQAHPALAGRRFDAAPAGLA